MGILAIVIYGIKIAINIHDYTFSTLSPCFITGLPVLQPSHKMDFRSSAAKNGLPREGRYEGLVPRNDVLTNGFI